MARNFEFKFCTADFDSTDTDETELQLLSSTAASDQRLAVTYELINILISVPALQFNIFLEFFSSNIFAPEFFCGHREKGKWMSVSFHATQ